MKSSLPRRRLIPRWRSVSQSLRTPETGALSGRIVPYRGDDEALEESVAQWRANPTAGHFGDVLSFGVHAELISRVLDIARESEQKGTPTTRVQDVLVKDLRDDDDGSNSNVDMEEGTSPFQARTRDLRRLLRVAPSNVLALLDFAQVQIAVGKQGAAQRTIKSALSLAPDNRLVLRTAARFLVHIGEEERAHELVRRHPRANVDPWLMASEIALSDLTSRDSTLLQKGRRLLKEGKVRAEHLSELAGAIASVELWAGQTKAARSAMRIALLHPTDNVMAQAITEQRSLGVRLDEPHMRMAISISSEAMLFEQWRAHDAKAAERHALEWHREEPFSSRPVQFLTALHSLRGDYETADRWVRAGIRADRNDFGLLCNLAFTSAALGKLQEAEFVVKKARRSESRTDPHLTATEGLIAMKRAQWQSADELYLDAIATFEASVSPADAALCRAYYAQAASEASHPDAAAIRAAAEEAVSKAPSHDALFLLGAPRTQAVAIVTDELRRTSQWIFDPVANTLTQKVGITAKGAPAIVVKRPDPATAKLKKPTP